MTELGDVAVMPETEAPVTAAAQAVCDRCGTFSQSRVASWGQQVCADCAGRLVAERRQVGLYPPGFIWGIGVLANGAFSCVMAALNWSRIGNRERARTAWGLAAGCVLATAVTIALKLPGVIVLVTSVTSTRLAVDGWAPLYEMHRAAGGRRASVLLPLAAILMVFVVVVLVVFAASP